MKYFIMLLFSKFDYDSQGWAKKLLVGSLVFTFLIILIFGIVTKKDQSDKKWAVLIFMHANNNLVNYSELDLREIVSLGGIEDFNLHLQINRSGKSSCGNENWEGSHRFRLHENGNNVCPSAGKIVDIKGKTVQQLFKEFVDETIAEYDEQDKKFLVVFWNHGNKWIVPEKYIQDKKNDLYEVFYNDYLDDLDSIVKCERARTGPESQLFSIPTDSFLGRVSYEDFIYELNNSTFLSPFFSKNDLANGSSPSMKTITGDEISQALQGKSIDIISFDACLLGTTEMAFSLKDEVEIMIASEEVVPACGFNYKQVLEQISNNPDIDEESLSKGLIGSYDFQYQYLTNYSLSALNLIKVESAIGLLDAISIKLINELKLNNKELLLKIQNARNGCDSYGWDEFDVGSVDLHCFLDKLKSQTINDDDFVHFNKNVSDLIELIENDLVIFEKSKDIGKNSQGIAIYFPKFSAKSNHVIPNAYDENLVNSTEPVLDFVKESSWDNFLLDYQNIIENQKF